MKIAIVGAGIGGLAAAILLERQGHRITVFERFDKPAPVGSGLMIQPIGLSVLERVGVAEQVLAMGTPISRILGRNAQSGKRVLDVSYGTTPGIGIHRSALFSALYDKAGTVDIIWRNACRIIGRCETSLAFDTGGSSEKFDLIVDASGATSNLSPLQAKSLKFGAIWGTVDWVGDEMPLDQLSQRYQRADRMVGILPIGRLDRDPVPKAALFWSLKQDCYEKWLSSGVEHWRDEVLALWPEVEPFVHQISSREQMTMARYSHGTLWRPYGERIVFIGDSAHRTSPQLGQGANMALLDAGALAQSLETHALDHALKVYAKARCWHIQAYQAISAMFTPAYQSDSRVLPFLRDNLLFPISQTPPVPYYLSRLVSGTLLPAGI